MKRQVLKTSNLFWLLLLSSFQLAAFPGEVRSYFKDWLVVCQEISNSRNSGICRANASVRDKSAFNYGDGTVFQLTLQRGISTYYTIEFYNVLDGKYPSDRVTFQIDNDPAMTFSAQPNSLNGVKLSAEDTQKLIPAMKAGRWMKIDYVSQSGNEVSYRLSLRGVTASLLFIEQFYINRG
ncbi:DUF1176 domain-containing protein [Grimontia marina]|uniref:Invasion associated locus B (IalB) protein n=1 Tax=Grimontia marina TaxID=646534 RepID=A0A128FBM2_9GAMM|nr:DUF1176 domain-containing protein [Grimontia marina]CZF83724.1 Invasion associated locus B (IalB) protein [Grimontia marina]